MSHRLLWSPCCAGPCASVRTEEPPRGERVCPDRSSISIDRGGATGRARRAGSWAEAGSAGRAPSSPRRCRRRGAPSGRAARPPGFAVALGAVHRRRVLQGVRQVMRRTLQFGILHRRSPGGPGPIGSASLMPREYAKTNISVVAERPRARRNLLTAVRRRVGKCSRAISRPGPDRACPAGRASLVEVWAPGPSEAVAGLFAGDDAVHSADAAALPWDLRSPSSRCPRRHAAAGQPRQGVRRRVRRSS